MKNLILFLTTILLFLSCKEDPILQKTIKNTRDIELTDFPVIISNSDLEADIKAEGLQMLIADKPIPFQADDLDGDGNWDELLTLIDIPANQSVNLSIVSNKNTATEATTPRTNIRMAKKTEEGGFELVDRADRLQGTETKVTSKYYQYEGPGWENDKIAFRNYFDERNGIDIFGKTTAEMTLDKVGVGASYHELQDWGMDILKVGNSLGAGAIALMYEDSLYRATAPEGGTYQLVTMGPFRSIFDLDFAEIQVGERVISLKHRITIVAGQYGYQSEVTIKGDTEGIQIVSGLVNLESEEAYLIEEGNMNVLYSYDGQAYDGENLGMALVASDQYYQKWFQTAEEGEGIVQTFAMVCNPDSEGKAFMTFLAGWELSDERFKTKEGFEAFLKGEISR